MISPHFELTGHEAKGLLYGLLEVNKQQLRENPGMPSMRDLIQQGKVRYEESDPGEHWQTYREMVEAVNRNGVAYADCEDLAPAVAAEDQVRFGVESLPYAYSPKKGLYHVVTAIPSQAGSRFGGSWPGAMGAPSMRGYTFIDPSAAAGMPTGHVGVRAKYGALTTPGSIGNSASASLVSAFLEGLGITPGSVNSDAAARRVGELLKKGVSGGASKYLESLDLGDAGKMLLNLGKTGKDSAAKSVSNAVDVAAEEAFGGSIFSGFGGLTEDAAWDVLEELRGSPGDRRETGARNLGSRVSRDMGYGRLLDSSLLEGVEEALEGHRFGSVY